MKRGEMWSARSVAGTRRVGSNPRPSLAEHASEAFADSDRWTLVPMLIASSARTMTSVLMLGITTTQYFRSLVSPESFRTTGLWNSALVTSLSSTRPGPSHTYLRKRTTTGGLYNCRAARCCLILAWNRGALLDGAERLQRDHFVNSFRMASKTSNQCPFRPTPTCVSHSTIYWVHYSRHPIQKVALFIQTDCSRVSAISSRNTLPIRTSVLGTWRSRRESRYATFRSSLRRETPPAVISYIRFVWITPCVC